MIPIHSGHPSSAHRAGAASHAGQAAAAHHALHGAHHLGQAAFLHLLHDGLHLRELVQQPVHVMHVHAGARGNAPLAGGLDQLGLLALGRCHGMDDALHAAHVALGLVHVLGAGLALDLGRHLLHQRAEPAQLLHLAQLGQEVLRVKIIRFIYIKFIKMKKIVN